jgi:outer membrane protein W
MAVSTMAIAQENSNSIGPTVGYNHTWMSGDGNSARPGFNAGIVYNNSFMEHWGAGLELKYSMEGTKFDGTDSNLNAAYLRLPLRLMYFFGDYGKAFRPKLYAGPSLGFMLSAKSDIGGNKVDYIDAYNRFDIGILGGVGFNYRIKDQTWLNFDLGYTHGLLDQSKTNSFDTKNRMINANIGIAFGF